MLINEILKIFEEQFKIKHFTCYVKFVVVT